MIWSYDSLWQKTKTYVDRALAQERESDEFALWSALTLEFLARATLARVHPALLADPRTGANLLHVFGYGTLDSPKSIMAKTVFERCRVIVPEFTKHEETRCLALIDRRNSELHSGELAFANFRSSTWLAEYYRAAEILLRSQERTLEDLLGPEEAGAAQKMVASLREAVLAETTRAITEAREAFEACSDAERNERRSVPPDATQAGDRIVQCPACDSRALVSGEGFRASEYKLGVGEVMYRELFVLPTRLSCPACGLGLKSHAELHVAEIGGQYSVNVEVDPAEVYGLEYVEEDYGND